MARSINREDAVVLCIDMQTNIINAMHEKEELEKKCVMLVEGAKEMGVPIVVTQQYTKGLGETIDSMKEALGDFEPFEKHTFSSCKMEGFNELMEATGKNSVIIFGIEAHVCVSQTAMDLMDQGYEVYVVEDCVSSRTAASKEMALCRMMAEGAHLVNTEAVLFECLEDSKAPWFKTISKLVK